MKEISNKELDNNLLYEFIENKKEERYILYKFINLQELNDDKFNELYENYINDKQSKSKHIIYYEYLQHNLTLIKELKETKKMLEKQLKILRNDNEQLHILLNKKQEENQQLRSQMSQKINENQDLKIKVSCVNNENEQLKADNQQINKYKEELQNQINQKNEENQQLQEKIAQKDSVNIELEKQITKLKEVNQLLDNIKQEEEFKEIPFQNEFEGILNYFQKHSNIKEELKISHPSQLKGCPDSLYNFEDKSSIFNLQNPSEQWICFEFKKHKIILTNYTIRAYTSGVSHPKSWIIEGSNDFNVWERIDEEKNCLLMKGWTSSKNTHVHTFNVQSQNQKSFKYIKLTQTDKNWGESNILAINCIEFYGQII